MPTIFFSIRIRSTYTEIRKNMYLDNLVYLGVNGKITDL